MFPRRHASIREVTTSSIPTLVIAGTFDAKTSPTWADYVAKTLSNSTTIIIPGIGHLVTAQSPAPKACSSRSLLTLTRSQIRVASRG